MRRESQRLRADESPRKLKQDKIFSSTFSNPQGAIMSASASDDANWIDGVCAACKQSPTPEGHDPCIANLPGVLFACCGHGNETGYIKFMDGRVIRFEPKEVDLDRPTTTFDGVPCFTLGGNRIFDFNTKKVRLTRYYTNIKTKE